MSGQKKKTFSVWVRARKWSFWVEFHLLSEKEKAHTAASILSGCLVSDTVQSHSMSPEPIWLQVSLLPKTASNKWDKHTHPYTYTLPNLPNAAAEQQQIKTFIIHKIPSGMNGEEEKT